MTCIWSSIEELSQNWRAAVAMVVSVPPTFPGLIESVRAGVQFGAASRLFDIVFMLGVSVHLLEGLTPA